MISYFFFFVSLIFHTLALSTLQLQRDALLEFKNEFPIVFPDPDPEAPQVGGYLSSWNESSNHCSWEGVTCDGKSGKVTSLVLDSFILNASLKSNTSLSKLQYLRELTLTYCELRGEIPSSLANLSHLTNLDLSNNYLVGKIPVSISNLSHLTDLDLSHNYLVGEIPSSVSNLSRLAYLVLDENHLVGEIPPSIGNLNQLISLSLSQNNLSGNIPISFASLTKLSNLDLHQNQFTGGDFPRILANLTSLQYLSLSYNHFKSRFPSDMTGLHNLVIFNADENSFVGNFPTSLFTIPSLTRVFLADNQLKGPLEFANISSSSSKLEYVYLASNNFYGPIPDLISRFPNLSFLDLSHNSFTGPIPKSISKLASLFSLDLSYNKLEGQVPGFLWRLHSLTLSHNSFSSLREPVEVDLHGKHYDLGSNSLQGLFPQWVCKFTSLELLDLSNNHLIGSIPQCLKNSTLSLETLNLGNNNFSGVLPDIFMNATRLQSLDVSHNQLVGKIPKSLIYTNLEFLNLKGNKIKDTFPSWLQSLRWLRVLLLGSNEFYGPICSPLSTYSGFSTLRIIDISHNSFNGTLPPDYFANWLEMYSVWMDEEELEMHAKGGGAPYWLYMEDSMDMMYKGSEMRFPKILLAYKAIDFSGNKFTGHIPESIGMLTEVLHLNLSGNAFTGNIPSSLANITNLEALDLSRNKLSGQIPRDLGNLSFLSYMDFSHNLLQGPVPRSTQFQRQNCSSFEDNLKLYGLEEICEKIHVPDAISKQPEDFSCETDQVLNWKAAAIAYGPGVFCGLVIGHIFASQKQKWFMEKFCRNKPTGTSPL